MAETCYVVSKSDGGWIISVAGTPVLDCRRKRSALAAAGRAMQLLRLIEPTYVGQAIAGAQRDATLACGNAPHDNQNQR